MTCAAPANRLMEDPAVFVHYRCAMGRRMAKKPLALLGTLGTMAGIWWFALRPRFRKRP